MVTVYNVEKNSYAHKAGILPSDILVSINGNEEFKPCCSGTGVEKGEGPGVDTRVCNSVHPHWHAHARYMQVQVYMCV